MRFPLNEKKLIRGFQAHIDDKLGGAADYIADYVPLYAPFDGEVVAFEESQGGLWLRITRADGFMIDFAHLSSRLKNGKYKEGEMIGTTGNTGTRTSGPHLHCQVFNPQRKRIDPENFFSFLSEGKKVKFSRLVKGKKDVYRIVDGKKDLFLNAHSFEALDGRWGKIEEIKQSELDKIPDGDVLIAVSNE